MADGKYKIAFPTGATAFTDDFHLAVAIAKAYEAHDIHIQVFEKTGSEWLHVYPV